MKFHSLMAVLPLPVSGSGATRLPQGGQAATPGWKQRLVRAIWPWPSLSWLDS